MNRVIRKVCLASAEYHKQAWHKHYATVPVRWRSGGRVATINGLTLHEFAAKFGNPHEAAPVEDWHNYDKPLLHEDGKVSAMWHFETPRGPVEVSDYWWNKKDELSVRAVDKRAMRWFFRWCKLKGLSIV